MRKIIALSVTYRLFVYTKLQFYNCTFRQLDCVHKLIAIACMLPRMHAGTGHHTRIVPAAKMIIIDHRQDAWIARGECSPFC